MKTAILILLLLVSIYNLPCVTIDDHLKLAISHFDSDPYKAEKELLKSIDNNPDWNYPYLLLAKLYENNFLMEKSNKYYLKALDSQKSLNGLDYEIYSGLLRNYLKIGKLNDAQILVDKMYKYFGEDEERLGRIKKYELHIKNINFVMRNKSINSVKIINSIIKENPDWFFCYGLIAEIYENQDEYNQAEKIYQKLLSLRKIKNIMLSGIGFTNKDGLYALVRNNETGVWSVSLQLPEGAYQYRFIVNYGLPDQIKRLDLSNNQVVKLDNGDELNAFKISKKYQTVTLQYPTLGQDTYLNRMEKKYALLRSRELNQKYSKKLYNGNIKAKRFPVNFKYYNPNAYAVWIIGSFNRYGINATEINELDPEYFWAMEGPDKKGYWELNAYLTGGEHYYNLVMDEDQVVKDPAINGHFDYSSTSSNGRYSNQHCYQLTNDYIEFYYNPAFHGYRHKVYRGLVSGTFNGWTNYDSSNQDSIKEWSLRKDDNSGLWVLLKPRSLVKENSEFKIVINENIWLDPSSATDRKYVKGGSGDSANNLIVWYDDSLPVKFNIWSRYSRVAVGELKDVVFTYKNKEAKSVRIAGSFNDWGKYITIPNIN